jgi:hypothetical protein
MTGAVTPPTTSASLAYRARQHAPTAGDLGQLLGDFGQLGALVSVHA